MDKIDIGFLNNLTQDKEWIWFTQNTNSLWR